MIITQNGIFILAIESSCDDTSAAVLHNRAVLSNVVASQDVHKQYGGVVPELAGRDHQKNIVPVADAALKKAGIDLTQINAVAFTRGPGLMGSLLVGASFAKSVAQALGVPLIEVNHMQAHVLVHFIENPKSEILNPGFPFLCLTVSGGHTQLIKVKDHLDFELLGETQDDAVGEAYDKAARILGLPYPGGPLIDKLAANGDPHKYKFPISSMPGLNYSFSGIKTAFLYFMQNETKKDPAFAEKNMADICASYQACLVEMLMKKLKLAIREHKLTDVALAGGVSANSLLRKRMLDLEQEGCRVFIPPFEYCTDNAAMVGIAGYFKYLQKDFAPLSITPTAQYSL
jgi:N6-L-threonylcarbamoyladenine synthase